MRLPPPLLYLIIEELLLGDSGFERFFKNPPETSSDNNLIVTPTSLTSSWRNELFGISALSLPLQQKYRAVTASGYHLKTK